MMRLTFSGLIFCLCSFCHQALAAVVVVVHPASEINNITSVQAANIFLGKTKTLPNDSFAIPIDLTMKNPVRREFYKKLINKNENQLSAYWARQVFTNNSQPPIQVKNSDEVKLLINANPNMIGYIDSEAVDDRVKVILRLP